jgi:hypothetical protein
MGTRTKKERCSFAPPCRDLGCRFLIEWADCVADVKDVTKSFRQFFDEELRSELFELPETVFPGLRATFILDLLELRLKFVEGEVENGPSVIRTVA